MSSLNWPHYRCPLDNTPLTLKGKTLHCQKGHCFDLAKQGYCHLLPANQKRTKSPGDNTEMVMARRYAMEQGFLAPLASEVCQLINDHQAQRIADAGCGEGFLLQQIRKQNPAAILHGNDISKEAIRLAARDKSIHWSVASNRQLPWCDNSIDLLICAFGFAVFPEFHRVLKKDGHLLMVDAGPQHLYALRDCLYDEVTVADDSIKHSEANSLFERLPLKSLQSTNTLDSEDYLLSVAKMTPHYFRAKHNKREELPQHAPLAVELDLQYLVMRKK